MSWVKLQKHRRGEIWVNMDCVRHMEWDVACRYTRIDFGGDHIFVAHTPEDIVQLLQETTEGKK